MKILFAVPDRDLLKAYEILLNAEGHQVSTAFDGTQVLRKLSEEAVDLLILSRDIPRIDCRSILRYCSDEETPVILLMHEKPAQKDFLSEALPNAFLSYPFDCCALLECIRNVSEKLKDHTEPELCGHRIHRSSFRIDSRRVTAEELDLLQTLMEEQRPNTEKYGVEIGSLNQKFRNLKIPACIRYEQGTGYRLAVES